MENPNFLILDEPTNDLDIMTLNVLEEWLMNFPGCIVIVSHDRYFMDKVVDHLFIFEGDGKIKDFNGNHLAYRKYIRAKELEKRQKGRAEQQKEKAANAVKEIKSDAPTMTYEQRKEMNKVEKEISKLEERKTKIQAKFASPDISVEEIKTLSQELSDVKEKIEEKEMIWVELAELA
jgi:ATP-binding cassette subfamily F protein uup